MVLGFPKVKTRDSYHPMVGNTGKYGIQKMEIQFFSVKDMHCG